MSTTFDEWLRQLGVASKGPVQLPPAIRGEPWSCLIELEGDWTGAALEGSFRVEPDAASVLGSFTVSGPVVASGSSTFTLSLTGTQTGDTDVIPADVDADGVTQLPYMLRLTPSGGSEELLMGGIFPTLGVA